MLDHLDKYKGAKVLVTGGLGFVGHNLVKYLLDNYQAHVEIVDDCSNASEKILERFSGSFNFHKKSVMDPEVMDLFQEVDYIFHLACKQISAAGLNPEDDLEVNALSTLKFLEYIRHNDLPNLKRFVYTSSCSVYGAASRLPLREEDATDVMSHYASTKLLGENYTLIYSRQYGVNTSSVRYSNVYGYGQTPVNPYCGVLGIFIHNALTGKPLTVIGDGEQTRDYTFVDDAVIATLLSGVHPKAEGEVYNVGTAVETSVNDLASIIKQNVGDIHIESIKERDIDNIRRRSVDIEKIHKHLGWAPLTNIHDGIAETLTWYKDFLNAN